ncbi:NADPH-dependent FMN reductase [Tenacibaculum sp. Bg11-29]|nr:flavodoxin family protein [Tenacibaculum sp. Bg11-29]PKH49921.1 NADPH-dependent FMN reductase [Tenacibaculum sp. Bg11-29]
MSNKQVTIAIIFHSGYGHTKKLAEAVLRGVNQNKFSSYLFYDVKEAQTKWNELALADAIIFGSPTYMGSASAQFKEFMDATSKNVFYKGFVWKDKLAAGFTNSASRAGDKLNVLLQFTVFAAQHGMHWINLGLPPANNSTTGSENDLNRNGYWLGAAAQSDADLGPELAPSNSDLKTGEHLGARVTTAALQFKYGKE